MVSPLRYENTLCISKYSPEEEAKFTAYMDIQQEVEPFLLPFEEDITTYIKENMFKQF